METKSAAKRRLQIKNTTTTGEDRITDGEDRITYLPDDVIHHILFFLPIKTIAQTSVLSKRWRTIWYTLPHLDFRATHSRNMGNDINKLLYLREKFSGHVRILRFEAFMTSSGLHTLLQNAVRLRVQELDISVPTSDEFNLPTCIISHDCLKVLKMSCYYGFRLPPSIEMKSGFQKLETLSLFYVHLNNQTSSSLDLFTESSFPQLRKLFLYECIHLKHLRVGCRLLEQLVIRSCGSLQGLEVLSPGLEKLDISNCFDEVYNFDHTFLKIDRPHTIYWPYNLITSHNISMQNIVCLHTVTIWYLHTPQILDANKIKLITSFLSRLGTDHTVLSLVVQSKFVEIMSKINSLAAIFFNPFEKLKSLKLFTTNAEGLASILKVCPMIHTLIIDLRMRNNKRIERRWNRQPISWDFSNSWKEQHWESASKDLEPLLLHLAVVKIQGSTELDISMVRFFLKHGKVLQEFTLCLRNYFSRGYVPLEELKSRIMEFPRASIDAKLAIY